MSQRNRGRWFAPVTIGFVLIEVVLVLLFIWDLSASQAENRIRAERYSDEYAAQAEQRISDVCSMSDRTALTECIRQIVEATHEHRRAEADLAAQRDMAKWAWAVVVVSIASLGVGLVGIYFIKRTYDKTAEAVAEAQHGNRQGARAALAAHESADQARRANEIAQRTGEAQVRAYLTCRAIDYVFDDYGLWVYVKVVNVGNSPAKWALLRAQAGLNNPFYEMGGVLPHLVRTEVYETVHGAIPPGVSLGESQLLVLWSHVEIGSDLHEAFLGSDRSHFSIDFSLEWMDVFDKLSPPLKFFGTSSISTLSGSGRGRRREGEMRTFNSAAEANHYAEQRRKANRE